MPSDRPEIPWELKRAAELRREVSDLRSQLATVTKERNALRERNEALCTEMERIAEAVSWQLCENARQERKALSTDAEDRDG